METPFILLNLYRQEGRSENSLFINAESMQHQLKDENDDQQGRDLRGWSTPNFDKFQFAISRGKMLVQCILAG